VFISHVDLERDRAVELGRHRLSVVEVSIRDRDPTAFGCKPPGDRAGQAGRPAGREEHLSHETRASGCGHRPVSCLSTY
jgi:hypothetical protein